MSLDPFDWQSLAKDKVLIGVDEVGRGCLAGPVYAAAVILDASDPEFETFVDSKSLSAKRREVLSVKIKERHKVALGIASVKEITELNILQASLLAMKRAVEKLNTPEAHLLIDGKFIIPGLEAYTQTAVIKGDFRVPCIGAASIVAKVSRDQLLTEMAEKYPQYGFEKHKAYATKLHKEAIREHGPCPEHRPSFAGVKEYI